jgi:hypothetical protein
MKKVDLTKALNALRSAGSFGNRVVAQLSSAKLTLTEILGAVGTLTGIGALTGWEYSAIIGGLAVVLAIERQPASSEKVLAAHAAKLVRDLGRLKANGAAQVAVDDVIKAL